LILKEFINTAKGNSEKSEPSGGGRQARHLDKGNGNSLASGVAAWEGRAGEANAGVTAEAFYPCMGCAPCCVIREKAPDRAFSALL